MRGFRTGLGVSALVAGAFVLATKGVGTSPAGVLINEVMYHPASGGKEWIELWNTSIHPVSLRDWTLEDSRRKPSSLASGNLTLAPGAFVVLVPDADAFSGEFPHADPYLVHELEGAWPALNNTQPPDRSYADLVILSDETGAVVDSLAYGENWGIPGYSLERLGPALGSVASNWCGSLAQDRATPGAPNSVYLEADSPSALVAEPNPFQPELDGVAFISFRISPGSPTVRLQIFDAVGRLVRTLLEDRMAGRSGRVAWDGRDDSGCPAPTGIYILYLQAIDVGEGVMAEAKGTICVARGFR
ncbi:MAG: lamin tail domain-containing protein [Candidatus Eisenbacteria sp.]|nr:lamin tail domain-containing protein [Candidatus Eisenbacteria bacterium]